ncbi:unnamed protein product [Nippostrongylus brasiliensis]|uniref:Kinesin motor domain-containing protein n=1 Tax=Nippostrongylus brasiliensis TaxID=27835 RepID=A0A158QZ38_NIPBR|nr:unnamed protein product [Nippostrongylus brasiliensis]
MEPKPSPRRHDRVCTGSVGEKIIVRTTTTRGSMRETITKALRSTLRRTTTEKSSSLAALPSACHRSLSNLESVKQMRPSHNAFPPVDVMSQSYIQPSTCSRHDDCQLYSSPSLTTLKGFDMMDHDDMKSMVSTASTSRLFAKEPLPMPKRYKSQNLRSFLNSPGVVTVKVVIRAYNHEVFNEREPIRN